MALGADIGVPAHAGILIFLSVVECCPLRLARCYDSPSRSELLSFPLTYQVLSVSNITFLYCCCLPFEKSPETRHERLKKEKWMAWTAFSCGVVSIASYY